MEHPELIQVKRTRRSNSALRFIVAFVIALAVVMIAAMQAKAETYQELQERYTKVEVGIAPPESNTFNTLDALDIVENPYQTIPISESEYEELRWVLALEAQGEGLRGEVACCEVIFNRVLSGRWGAGVHGVLSKKGQFSTYRLIGSRKAWAVPGELEDDAISECLRQGLKVLPDMKYVYFDTGKKNGSRNIKLGNHWFGAEK